MSRYKWTAKEPGNVVEGPNYRKQVSIHSRLKRQNDTIDAMWRQARKQWVLKPPSNMTVTLHKDTGSMPAGLVLSVPHHAGALILCKRLGRIIERDDVAIDAVIEGSLEDAFEAFGLGSSL